MNSRFSGYNFSVYSFGNSGLTVRTFVCLLGELAASVFRFCCLADVRDDFTSTVSFFSIEANSFCVVNKVSIKLYVSCVLEQQTEHIFFGILSVG